MMPPIQPHFAPVKNPAPSARHEDSEYYDYDCKGERSRSHSSKNRRAPKETEQPSRGSDNRYYRDTDWSPRLRLRGLHRILISRLHDKPIGHTDGMGDEQDPCDLRGLSSSRRTVCSLHFPETSREFSPS